MSGRKPKRLGSSRRGPRGLTRNNEEKDNDDGIPQIAECEVRQSESHTTTGNQSGDTVTNVQFDHLSSSSIVQQISSFECSPHASYKDAVMETELPERKRKMGSTRKSSGGFKGERKLECEAVDEMRTTEELSEEQLAEPITSAIEDHSNLHEQSRSWNLPSNLSQQTESSGLGGELKTAHIEVMASKNNENDAIQHLEITSQSHTKDLSSYDVERKMGLSSVVTLTESDLLLQEQTPLASTTGQKRKMGSTRRPLMGNRGEEKIKNLEVLEHSRSTERVEKAEVQAEFNLSGEMMQTWDVVRADSTTDTSSHTELAFISNQSFLFGSTKESDVSAGTETKKQSVAFPVVDPAKPLPETSSHDGPPLLTENVKSKNGSDASNLSKDFDACQNVTITTSSLSRSEDHELNTDLKEVGCNFTDWNHNEPDPRSDKNTSEEFKTVNTGKTEEVLKQKEEPSRNDSINTLSSKQETVSEELVFNDEECSSAPRQHHSATTDNNCDLSTDVLTTGGSRSSDKLELDIIHAEPTATDSPLEMSDTDPYIHTSEFVKKETFIGSSTSKQRRNIGSSQFSEGSQLSCDAKPETNVCSQLPVCSQSPESTINNAASPAHIGSPIEEGQEIYVDKKQEGNICDDSVSFREVKLIGATVSVNSDVTMELADANVNNLEGDYMGDRESHTLIVEMLHDNKKKCVGPQTSATGENESMVTETESKTDDTFEMIDWDDVIDHNMMEKTVKERDNEDEGGTTTERVTISNQESCENSAKKEIEITLKQEQRPSSNISQNKSGVLQDNVGQHLSEDQQRTTHFEIDNPAFVSHTDFVMSEALLMLEPSLNVYQTQSGSPENDAEKKLGIEINFGEEKEGETENTAVEDVSEEIFTLEEVTGSHVHQELYSLSPGKEGNDVIQRDESVYEESEEKEILLRAKSECAAFDREDERSDKDLESLDSKETEKYEEMDAAPAPILDVAKHLTNVNTEGNDSTPDLKTENPEKNKESIEEQNYTNMGKQTLNSEGMMNVEEEILSLEKEPSPVQSKLRTSKTEYGATEPTDIGVENNAGPSEGFDSTFTQPLRSSDLVSEESTAASISDNIEAKSKTEFHAKTLDNAGDVGVPVGGDTEPHLENQIQNITVDSTMVTDSGLLFREVATVGSEEEVTVPEISLIPEDSHRQEVHSKLNPIAHKRKMGSTRRPLSGNKGQRKGKEHHDEDERLNSEGMINVEEEIFSLEAQNSADESTLRTSETKDGTTEIKREIGVENNTGPVVRFESALMPSLGSSDLEESTAVSISDIIETQSLTEFHSASLENTGDVEGLPVEGDTKPHLEIQTQTISVDSTTNEGERTEENSHDNSVLVKDDEVIGDIITVKSNMTIDSDFLQNYTSHDANLEAFKVTSENVENVSPVTDSGLLLREVATVGSEEEDTVPEIRLIPEDSHRQEVHSKFDPIPHKRKMGSTRRPLGKNKEKRKGGEESKERDGDKEGIANEENGHSKILDQDKKIENNMMDVTDNKRENGKTTKTEPCNDSTGNEEWFREIILVQEQRSSSNISETQIDAPQDDACPQLPEDQEGIVDFFRDNPACVSRFDPVLADALMEEAKIHASSEHVVMLDSCAPQTEDSKMHGASNRSLQKRKIGSSRKTQRGKRMENEIDVKEEKENDNATKTEETFTLQESNLHQQPFSLCFDKESHDIQHDDSKPYRQTENPDQNEVSVEEQNDPNSNKNLKIFECASYVTAENVSDLPLEDVVTVDSRETDTIPKQIEITSIMPEESYRGDVQSNLYPVVQKQKFGLTCKILKGQRKEEYESKEKDGDGAAKEWNTEPNLVTCEGESEMKFNGDTQRRGESGEVNRYIDWAIQPAATSKIFFKPEDEVNKVSVVSQEKGPDNTENEIINLYEGTEHKCVLTLSPEDTHQTISEDYFDPHAYKESEPEETESTFHLVPSKELKSTQDDENRISATKGKKRKMGSTRKNPRVQEGKMLKDQDDFQELEKEHLECTEEAGTAEDRQSEKKPEENRVYLDDFSFVSSEKQYKFINTQSKDVSSEAFNIIDPESEILVSTTDLKEDEKDYQIHSDLSESMGPEKLDKSENCQTGAVERNTLQICDNPLTMSKHPQSEAINSEKKRKMGSTRKNLRGDKREDIACGMNIVGKAVGEQTDSLDKSEGSLLSEIESMLNKTSQIPQNLDYELIINDPNSSDLINTLDETYYPISMTENSQPQDGKVQGSSLQSSKTNTEPSSPGTRRKMGSTRKNPRQQLKLEKRDDEEEAKKIAENLETSKQERIAPREDLEAAEEPNITENKGSKEYLDVPSALTSSYQLEESGNPIVQERTSPSAKRKFGSRRANKGNRGLGVLATSESGNEFEEGEDKPHSSGVQDNLPRDDLTVSDPCHSLRPDQPIFQSDYENSNMEARNEEAAKSLPQGKAVSIQEGTGACLVSLDQIIKAAQHDRSPESRQTTLLKKSTEQGTEVAQFNVVIVGNSCVGKTSFIRRFNEGQFSPDYRSTIGVDTCVQTVELHDRFVKLYIWDTAGQERFHSITTQVFHKADGLLLMYEITSPNSFISVRDWISKVQERAPDDVIMMLLGNKNDCVERKVQIQEGEDLAREYNINFMECSASTGDNVSESMRTLAQLLVQQNRQKKQQHTTLKREQPQKSGCC
ncbi:uncharacterized protein LOC127646166 [Xyrauchen texanus]|uniref:uncharacterized protein LOC127646166 n=1 Tax=Xyrauchen texanus TaxID=154827 RepID=UPI002242823D|nr:uncharacterized protein LOC127646166 [Xyrauchen texanus]